MKTTVTGFILYKPGYGEENDFTLNRFEMKCYDYVTVMPYSAEVEIPYDFDPRSEQIKILEEEKRQLRVKFQLRITDIERKIGELTALEYVAEES